MPCILKYVRAAIAVIMILSVKYTDSHASIKKYKTEMNDLNTQLRKGENNNRLNPKVRGNFSKKMQ